MGEWIIFYLLAGLAVVASLGVVVARHPIRAALMTGLAFLSVAAVGALLGEMIAACLHVGLATLFIFLIILLWKRLGWDQSGPRTEIHFAGVATLLVGGVVAAFVWLRLAEFSGSPYPILSWILLMLGLIGLLSRRSGPIALLSLFLMSNAAQLLLMIAAHDFSGGTAVAVRFLLLSWVVLFFQAGLGTLVLVSHVRLRGNTNMNLASYLKG